MPHHAFRRREFVARAGRTAAGALSLLALAPLAACSPQTPAPAAGTAAPTSAAPAAAARTSAVTLRAGTPTAKGDILADTVDKFAELVAQKSGGGLTVSNLYQALGVEQQLTQAVKSGSVDIGQLANGNAASFTSALLVYDLPFIFKDNDALLRSLDSPTGRKLIGQFEQDLGVKYLFPISNGSGRDIETRSKELRLPSDIKGLKMRVTPSPVDRATFGAWGANPTPIDFGQTYSALQQGVVDGVALPIPIVEGSKFYEVVKYGLAISYQGIFANVYINAQKFNTLSRDHQQVLLDAAQEARTWNYAEAARRAQSAASNLTSQDGMTIYQPSSDEYAQWTGIRESVWQSVAQENSKIDLSLANELYQSQG
jgi:tripartite ATP-independent transporter DctP family solute receptor